jgi:hypothetical protein
MTNHVGIAEGEAAVLRLHHQLGRRQAQPRADRAEKKVMGKYKNSTLARITLYPLGGIVTLLNMALFISLFQ